jgi:hypothetical protein
MFLSRHPGAAVVAAAVLAGLTLWGLFRIAGVELDLKDDAATDRVRAVDVLVATTLTGLAAWGIHNAMVRRHDEGFWPLLGSTVLSVSIIGPVWLADGESAVALIFMHFAVGAILIFGLARFAGTPTTQPEVEERSARSASGQARQQPR